MIKSGQLEKVGRFYYCILKKGTIYHNENYYLSL